MAVSAPVTRVALRDVVVSSGEAPRRRVAYSSVGFNVEISGVFPRCNAIYLLAHCFFPTNLKRSIVYPVSCIYVGLF